eukprot:jgi/Astpho2/1019/e_gw1.00016.175.1_t
MSRVRVIIKLGGAAITDKEQFETAKQDVIQQLAQQIANMLTCQGGAAIIVHGAGRCCCRSDIGGLQFISVQQSSECYMCACSFGHHQASQYGVAAGGISRPDVRHGFALTRQSVLKLNQLVVPCNPKFTPAAAEGLPACSVSPCLAWVTSNRHVTEHGCRGVHSLLEAGLLPVLHGDCVLDESLGCTILSGDTIVAKLAEEFKPKFVVFMTNVAGLLSCPPIEGKGVLLRHVAVTCDGAWSVSQDQSQPNFIKSQRDTTGGMAQKVKEAAQIAGRGIPVLLAQAGTKFSMQACKLGPAALKDLSWKGTSFDPPEILANCT